jgi:drug/metabolite transporter (DMT)-like permease
MALAGVAWGAYSLRGRREADPIAATASNFAHSVPLVLAVILAGLPRAHVSPDGVLLALASGTLASRIGYVVWYAALPRLSAVRSAIVQLSVPVLAAIGGVAFLAETVSLRLVVSAMMILGGVGMAVLGRQGLLRFGDVRIPALPRSRPRAQKPGFRENQEEHPP